MPGNRRHILVADRAVPTHDRDSGSLRMYSILKILAALPFYVTFLPGNGKLPQPYTDDLKKLGIEVLPGGLENHLRARGGRYFAALLSRPEEAFRFLPLVRALALNSKVVYDTIDVHWLRYLRGAGLPGGEELLKKAAHYRRIEEINARCSDLTLAVTGEDRGHLVREFPGIKVEVLPNIHDPAPSSVPFGVRKDLMFIGGFDHQPNVDAILYFSAVIFPLVREKIPGVRLYVVGSHPPERIAALSGRDITVTGYVKDVRPYFDHCRVFVCPLRYGSGMKGKIGQSMAHGLPVVTTPVGAEGMGLADGVNALIAEDPEDFAGAVARLYTDEKLWRSLSAKSARHIAENYSPRAVLGRLERILHSLEAAKILLPAFYSFSPGPSPETDPPRKEAGGPGREIRPARPRGTVLVAGVYLADRENRIDHLVGEFAGSKNWRVVQKWAAIGKAEPPGPAAGVTALRVDRGDLKYAMINRLLAGESTGSYDYIILSDDDITLPPAFLDTFLDLQSGYDFALAQPARTHNSYIDHVMVEKIDGIRARLTRFNEIGPLNSFRRDAFRLVFPFDVSLTPMGWGFDFVWPLIMDRNGLRTGIIDATPVDHSLRKPVAYYAYEEARRQMEDYLAKTPHYPLEEAFTILESYA